MKKVLFWLIIIAIGITVGSNVSHFTKGASDSDVLSVKTNLPAKSESTETPEVATPGIPVKISIPKIDVEADIESVAMDSEGRMDVPKDDDNTAWYNPGFRPGLNGSAVIAGHYDKKSGAPSVFYDVNKLSAGDEIVVTDDKGVEYTFAVVRLEKYPDATFPIQQVFSASDVPQLNLITCQGTWDSASGNYSDRMVVFSKLVSHT